MTQSLLLRALFATVTAALTAVSAPATYAQDNRPADAKAEELTEEEIKEREARKACKVSICAAFHNRKPDGGDITCNVIKSWRESQLQKVVSKGGVSWPWGRVKCTADIKLKRDTLIKAMSEPKHEATLDKHQVACEVEKEGGKSDIKFEFSPKVTFEKGKATKAVLNWGKVEAPTLVKGAMWTATATDNTFNVLQGTIIDDINDFIDVKCMEVKEDWQNK